MTTLPPTDGTGGRSRLLIVDDEPRDRRLLQVMVHAEGYDTDLAGSGEEALRLVRESPPDLILLDVVLSGIDGYQVVQRLKDDAATSGIPVIMITALDDRDARIVGLSSGAEDFLSKPVDRVELSARVRNLLRLKRMGDEHEEYRRSLEEEIVSRTADLVSRAATLERQTAVLSEQAALLDLARDAIVVRDMQQRVVFWSRGAEALYGWHSDEAVGRDANALLRTEYAESAAAVDAALLRDGRWEGEAIQYTRHGLRLHVETHEASQRDTRGVAVRTLTITNDITARKRADAELQLLTERLSLATAAARIGVWEWDLTSNAVTWDDTMFGIYDRQPVVPLPYEAWTAAVHPDDLPALQRLREAAIAEKGHRSSEFRIVTPSGAIRTVLSVERAILDERNGGGRVIGVNMDVTARKLAEQENERIREEQLRFKDEFLSHVSHELRSPLTAIKQFTSILFDGQAGELNPEQRQFQQIVLRNVRQLQSMIDDLLEITRLETGKLTVHPECVELHDVVTDTFNTLLGSARDKGVTLQAEPLEDAPAAYADPTRLRQVMIILLENAIKFTPAGGSVTVRGRVSAPDGRLLRVEVADTGCGIGSEMSDRLFERLFQVTEAVRSSRKGLGLGLYICRELVERQGGRIWAERRDGDGSTFVFTVPLYSLRNLLAPLLRDTRWPAESVALVTVNAQLQAGGPTDDTQQEWLEEARALVQLCLLPDLDVLLPTMSAGPHGSRFLVAAFTDDKGVSVLVERIRTQFARQPHLARGGRAITVSYRMVPLAPRAVDATTDAMLDSMVHALDGAVTPHPGPGGEIS
jgi:PAS domain S-box-containing protein